MRVGLGLRLTTTSLSTRRSKFAAYVLALEFKKNEYWTNGAQIGVSEGPELISNGSFTNDLSGWTATRFTQSGGTALGNTNGVGDAILHQSFSTVVGSVYKITYDYIAGNLGNALIRVGPTVNSTVNLNLGMSQGPGAGYIAEFTATVTTTIITLVVANVASITGQWDNISVKAKAGISQFPGHSFTRSGAKGEVNASAAANRIDNFAANVPGIVKDIGYLSRAALTNNVLQSQDYTQAVWTKNSTTIAANTVVAPNGTTTADMLTATGTIASVAQEFTAAASTNYSTTFFIPPGGNSAFAYIQINVATSATVGASDLGAAFITLDRTTGALSASQLLVAGIVLTGYSTSVTSGGWRLTVTYTTPATTVGQTVFLGLSDTTATRNTTVGNTLPAWQGQTYAGNLPYGGPIISTTATVVNIGADDLRTGVVLADQDMFVWIVASNLSPIIASNNFLLDITAAGSTANRIAFWRDGANAYVSVASGGVSQLSGNRNHGGANRIVIGARRRGGKWTFANKIGTTVVSAEGAASLFPVGLTRADIGSSAGSAQAFGVIEGVFVRSGTFDDADITAILDAA